MKSIIFEKYKLINITLFLSVLLLVGALYVYVSQGYCLENCSLDLKKGIMNPLFSGGKWLAAILGILILFPAHIFRKWLFYVAPVVLLLTWYLVQGISVYSSNLLNPTRAKMAENGMMLLAGVTVVFVLAHLIYDWHKKKMSKTA